MAASWLILPGQLRRQAMAGYGRVERRLQELERVLAEPHLLCAETLHTWLQRQRMAGDPGGLLAAAAVRADHDNREACRAWETQTAPPMS